MTRTPEGKLRQCVKEQMSPHWLITWHEDREINPGVPDLSFVPRTGSHETGWIELKRVLVAPGEQVKFKIEPSQHQWVEAHCPLIPVHFIVAVNDVCYFVPGSSHRELSQNLHLEALGNMALSTFPMRDMAPALTRLGNMITKRQHGEIR